MTNGTKDERKWVTIKGAVRLTKMSQSWVYQRAANLAVTRKKRRNGTFLFCVGDLLKETGGTGPRRRRQKTDTVTSASSNDRILQLIVSLDDRLKTLEERYAKHSHNIVLSAIQSESP